MLNFIAFQHFIDVFCHFCLSIRHISYASRASDQVQIRTEEMQDDLDENSILRFFWLTFVENSRCVVDLSGCVLNVFFESDM